jgi:hypothetical protein
MIRCAVCGRILQGVGGVQAIYRHPEHKEFPCTETSKRIHRLDQLVLGAIRDVALDPELERRVQQEVRAFQRGGSTRADDTVAKLEHELKQAADKLELLEADLDKLTEREARDRALIRIDKQTAAVTSLKAQIATERANRDSLAAAARAESILLRQHSVIRKVLDSGDRAAKRILISNIAERISARPSTRQVEIALRYS